VASWHKGVPMRTVLLRVILAITASAALAVTALAAPAGAKVSGPNGEIVFSRYDPNLGDTVTYIVNPDGSHLHKLLPVPSPGTSENPRWSPDGSKIALLACLNPPICDTAAVIVNPDTGSFYGLTMPDPNIFTPCVVWSADGTRLACEGSGVTDPSLNGIYTIRTSDGRGLTRVTSNPGGDDIPIDYSPNGKQIVFDRTDPNGPPGNNQALFVVNLNGSGLHRITPWGFSDDDGSWSPDGSKILFEHFGSLYTVHPDGTGLSKLSLQTGSSTTARPASDAGWSPDGTKIVFSLSIQGPTGSQLKGIATANADGSDVQMITTSPTRDSKGDWGPHPLAG
jgi:Tol biopolymer transport system component